MKKSWMNVTIFESLCIEFSDFKILILSSLEFLRSSDEHCFDCSYIMSDSLKFSVGFYPWILEEISINSCNLVRLVDLLWNVVEIIVKSSSEGMIYHILPTPLLPPITVRRCPGYCSCPPPPKKDPMVFQSFLEDVF